MATKPTALPRWGDVSGDIVEPTSGKKDIGWAAEERPPAQYDNWFKNLVYQWFDYFNDGAVYSEDETDNTPQWSFGDPDGRVRMYIDKHGNIAGPTVNLTMVGDRRAAALTNSSGLVGGGLWGASNSANSEIDQDNPDTTPAANFPKLHLQVDSAAAATTDTATVYGPGTGQISDLDEAVLVAEWRAALSAVGTGTEVDVWMGFTENPTALVGAADGADETQYGFALFEKLSADTNWQTRVADGAAATDADSGTAPTADTFQTFRVEYHGVDTPLGVTNASATVRFFIDGAEEAEVTGANVPTSADTARLGFVLSINSTATGPSSDTLLYVSPIHIGWNMELAGAIPA